MRRTLRLALQGALYTACWLEVLSGVVRRNEKVLKISMHIVRDFQAFQSLAPQFIAGLQRLEVVKMSAMTKEEEFMEHAKEDARKAMELAKAKFMEAEKEVETSIKSDPVRAAMIAAGLGAAVGAAVTFALMRKKKDEK